MDVYCDMYTMQQRIKYQLVWGGGGGGGGENVSDRALPVSVGVKKAKDATISLTVNIPLIIASVLPVFN